MVAMDLKRCAESYVDSFRICDWFFSSFALRFRAGLDSDAVIASQRRLSIAAAVATDFRHDRHRRRQIKKILCQPLGLKNISVKKSELIRNFL